MANPDIATQLKAAQTAGDLIGDRLESVQDPGQKAQLEQQGLQILDQVNRLQSMQMVACTADIAAQTPKLNAAKNDLQRLFQSDANVSALINGVDSFLTVVDTAVQMASKAIV
jgi:hypothetical protein